MGYDILGESSPVPSTSLCPAEKLQWKISPETANDIQTAKKNLDEYVTIHVDVHVHWSVCAFIHPCMYIVHVVLEVTSLSLLLQSN